VSELDEIRERLRTGDYSNYKFHPFVTVLGVEYPVERDCIIRAIRNRPPNPEVDMLIAKLIEDGKLPLVTRTAICHFCGKDGATNADIEHGGWFHVSCLVEEEE
jgi:hypothetical protein